MLPFHIVAAPWLVCQLPSPHNGGCDNTRFLVGGPQRRTAPLREPLRRVNRNAKGEMADRYEGIRLGSVGPIGAGYPLGLAPGWVPVEEGIGPGPVCRFRQGLAVGG